jgi:hypothetical protein
MVNCTAPCRSAWTESNSRARSAGAKVIEEEYAEFEKLAEAWPERGRVLPGGDAPRDTRRGGSQRSAGWRELRNDERSPIPHDFVNESGVNPINQQYFPKK